MEKRISYSKILTRSKTKGNSKVRCDKCGKVKRIKFMTLFKDKIKCSNCRPNIIRTPMEAKD